MNDLKNQLSVVINYEHFLFTETGAEVGKKKNPVTIPHQMVIFK